MNKTRFLLALLISSQAIAVYPAYAAQVNKLTIYQVMQRVIDRYPALKMSALEVEQAAEQKKQIESSLGWALNSSAETKHDLNGFGIPSDNLNLSASIGRQLKSGGTLSLSGGYSYADSSYAISPMLDPVHSTRLDLSYRLPLAQGEGNLAFSEGLASADASHQIAKASQLQLKISLADQVKSIFYAAATTLARLDTAKQAVERTKKLQVYINSNFKLGLAEEQDKLQIKAQLQSKLADLSTIELLWQQQKTSLNRLMNESRDKDIYPVFTDDKALNTDNVQKLIKVSHDYHPAVAMSQAKLQIAESQIQLANDTRKDNLDLVVSVGTRTSNGKSGTATVSKEDLAGTVRIEYKHLFDDKGVSSKYVQAQLQRDIALEEINKVDDDIRYTVSGLVAEIKAARNAVEQTQLQLKSEALKLKEAEHRFRTGRANTAQLIQFQNEYSFSQLAFHNQQIELQNRIVSLQIFIGTFWTNLNAGVSATDGAELHNKEITVTEQGL